MSRSAAFGRCEWRGIEHPKSSGWCRSLESSDLPSHYLFPFETSVQSRDWLRIGQQFIKGDGKEIGVAIPTDWCREIGRDKSVLAR